MPDPSQSPELLALRTVFPPNIREVETIALRQRKVDVEDELDLVFLMDTTGSMSGQLEDVAASLAGVAANLAASFSTVRYAIVDYKDEDGTSILGGGFVDLATAQALLDGLIALGGGDSPENGYGAITLGASLPWGEQSIRAMILISDIDSHERGSTFSEAEYSLLQNSIYFFSGLDLSDPEGYDLLVSETGGTLLASGTIEEITLQISDALIAIAADLLEPVYLVNDNVEFPATLETGEEVTFLNRSFAINPFTSGEDGALSISLSIDNTDFAVSRYLARAKANPIALEVTLRIYASDDSSQPLNNPPFSLFATEFETKGSVVSCQMRWLDLHNAPFPNAFYTSQRSPSLQ